MDNSKAADLIDRVAAHASVIAAPLGLPGPLVSAVTLLLQGLAEHLRASNESLDEIVASIRPAQFIKPAAWHDVELPVPDAADEPAETPKKKRRAD